MSSPQILKEYLLALGFKVDQTSVKKFDEAVGKLDTGAADLAKRVLGVAAAAQVMVAVFARSMEKLYYASKRTDSTVGNIQALEYAGRQLGLGSGEMQQALESMARALRANPGLTGLLNDLGIKVTGRDKSDVLSDLVTQLNKMPFYVAQQYAGLFGINPDDLFMLQQSLVDFQRLRAERQAMNKEAGIDADAAAASAKEYANALRQVEERLGVLKDIVSVAMLPYFKDMTTWIIQALDALNRWLGAWSKVPAAKQLGDAGTKAKDAAGGYWDFTKKFWGGLFGGDAKSGAGAPKTAAPGSAPAGGLFADLEAKYGLPAGLLDRMWKKESNRGDPRYMKSGAGALGHFQFMPDTAKDMGLKDPNNLAESATAAARYMQQLMGRYNGDLQKALAAYNWGMGNVDRKGLGKAPWETQDYVATISGRPIQITQTNTFQINGAQDPGATADAIGSKLGSANSNMTRNLQGALQ